MNRFNVILQSWLLFCWKRFTVLTFIRFFSSMSSLMINQCRLISCYIKAITERTLIWFFFRMWNHMQTKLWLVWSRKTTVRIVTSERSLSSMITTMIVHIFKNRGSELTTGMQTTILMFSRMIFEMLTHFICWFTYKIAARKATPKAILGILLILTRFIRGNLLLKKQKNLLFPKRRTIAPW